MHTHLSAHGLKFSHNYFHLLPTTCHIGIQFLGKKRRVMTDEWCM
jgi:hypothetical protein